MFVLANSINEMTETLKLHYSPLSWQRAAFIRVELRYTRHGRRERFSATPWMFRLNLETFLMLLWYLSLSTNMLLIVPTWPGQIINFHEVKNGPLKQGIFKWGKESFNWRVSFRDEFIQNMSSLLTLFNFTEPPEKTYFLSLILWRIKVNLLTACANR